MPKMLNDGAVEYEDGIPATEAQVTSLAFELHNYPYLLHLEIM